MFDQTQLNAAILALAPAHDTRPDAPESFAALIQCRGRLVLPVWEGASDATIFQDARVNHAFRAWHDATHIAGQFSFTLEGETETCEAQVRDFYRQYPCAPQWVARLLRAEVTGQAMFFAAHGTFPADQAAFVRQYL